MGEKRWRFKCHGCGKVWHRDFDVAPRVGVLPARQGPAGFTFGEWTPDCPNGCRWTTYSRRLEESYALRMEESHGEVEDVFV